MGAVASGGGAPRLPHLADWRAWTLAQPAYRMDAGTVAAMTPAGRFAERRKRRQKPPAGQARTGQAGPVARHPGLTRYPGPKPPPFARRGADGHGRRRVRGIPQPESPSTRHLRGVAYPHGPVLRVPARFLGEPPRQRARTERGKVPGLLPGVTLLPGGHRRLAAICGAAGRTQMAGRADDGGCVRRVAARPGASEQADATTLVVALVRQSALSHNGRRVCLEARHGQADRHSGVASAAGDDKGRAGPLSV